jgi:2-succinyl-5-enolpyruvyl-6-hydroxy-3-cyclohexene-1-carboxylate synthase
MLHEARQENDFRHAHMIPINSTFAPIQAFVDELARFGMSHAVTCPGSRNAPLALVLAQHPDIEAISVVDERSAAFVALGIAKEIGGELPVAITTTSGTAAANLMPAVVEAHEAAIPLLVLTADRPPELREVGAGQAIDQIKLYGSFVKWFAEVGNHPPGRASAIHHRQLACRAAALATGGRPGPVHLNWPLREPLAPLPDDALDPADWEGRPDGKPWTDVGWVQHTEQADPDNELTALLTSSPRGLVVCGGGNPYLAAAGLELGWRLRWPVLAEPTSGARRSGRSYDPDPVIAHYDLLLRSESFAAERPDLVVRVGEMPTSKPLRAWLTDCRQIVIDPHMDWHDPTRTAESIWPIGAGELYDLLPETSGGGDPRWLNRWRAADAIVPELLADAGEPFEPLAYNAAAESAALLWVSSSLPIRDVESYLPHTGSELRVLANRGANGIDGVVSSAAGAALSADTPVHVLIGELALLHDIGGLITARRAGAELAILCVNNGGGGIFDFLPVAEAAERADYEQHIATPVDIDLAAAAQLGGLEHHVVTTADGVREQLRPGALVELRVDRADSLRRHRELAAQIVERLDSL